ncbi:MAG: DUF4197 domain-containing protein [Bacteroidota bacterium]
MKSIRFTFASLCGAALLAGCLFSFTACDEDTLPGLSNTEIVEGLKTALRVGTDTSVATLNQLDGYYQDQAVKIFLPPEADVIFDKLGLIPGGDALLETTIRSINRAAEDAAGEATPIFVDAITGMTISDGLSILNGSETAATEFLRTNTETELFDAFQPKISTSLGKEIIPGISAEQSYADLVNAYNTASLNGFLFPEIQENTLSSYVTQQGLNGLFTKVADEERLIRTDPLHRVTDVLERVFGL